jgi:hypothetical protein
MASILSRQPASSSRSWTRDNAVQPSMANRVRICVLLDPDGDNDPEFWRKQLSELAESGANPLIVIVGPPSHSYPGALHLPVGGSAISRMWEALDTLSTVQEALELPPSRAPPRFSYDIPPDNETKRAVSEVAAAHVSHAAERMLDADREYTELQLAAMAEEPDHCRMVVMPSDPPHGSPSVASSIRAGVTYRNTHDLASGAVMLSVASSVAGPPDRANCLLAIGLQPDRTEIDIWSELRGIRSRHDHLRRVDVRVSRPNIRICVERDAEELSRGSRRLLTGLPVPGGAGSRPVVDLHISGHAVRLANGQVRLEGTTGHVGAFPLLREITGRVQIRGAVLAFCDSAASEAGANLAAALIAELGAAWAVGFDGKVVDFLAPAYTQAFFDHLYVEGVALAHLRALQAMEGERRFHLIRQASSAQTVPTFADSICRVSLHHRAGAFEALVPPKLESP